MGDQYSFVIIADPQVTPGGGPGSVSYNSTQTMRQTVREINAMDPPPAFVIFIGDLVNTPVKSSWDHFLELAEPIEPLTLLTHGNHDGKPPYEDFRRVQKRLNGCEATFYSFDVGQWHFSIAPSNFQWGNYSRLDVQSELIHWLRRDMAENRDRPTVMFEHLHAMPQGLSQLEWYTFYPDFMREFLDLLSEQGNVKYYVNGHVHNGIQSSYKTAWTYRGINFITAPTIIESRPFGEEFEGFNEGMERGGYYMVAHVDGEKMTMTARLAGADAVYTYPDRFKEFTPEIEPRWTSRVIDIEPHEELLNPSFEDGLDQWSKPFRYIADEDPGFRWEVRTDHKHHGDRSAFLYTQPMGQEWINDEYIELYQLAQLPEGGPPVVRAHYRLDEEPLSGGGWIRIDAIREAGEKDEFEFLAMFEWGNQRNKADYWPRAINRHITGEKIGWTFPSDIGRSKRGMYFELPMETDVWHSLTVNLRELYDKAQGKPGAFDELGVTKINVSLGMWTNRDKGVNSHGWFDDLALYPGPDNEVSNINGQPLKFDDSIWETDWAADLIERERIRREQNQ